MQYLVHSGSIDVPVNEHTLVGSFADIEQAEKAVAQESQMQQRRHTDSAPGTNASASIEIEPADGVTFIAVNGQPRWRIAISLDLPLFGSASLLDEITRDINAEGRG